jgi:S-adenosylmethionine-diacylgycerolhomoserine-N-methlytransferase
VSLHSYYRWHAHIYDATRWAFLFGRTDLVRSVAALSPRRILEVGCGTGRNLARLAAAFPHARIVGLDLSPEMLTKARRTLAPFGPRITLVQQRYTQPLSADDPFDLIVFSYCLTMVNPGYADLLRICRHDLAPHGRIAIVDFHDSAVPWFRRWMQFNHVRMEGQILDALHAAEFRPHTCTIHSAYAGLWRWFTCLATR